MSRPWMPFYVGDYLSDTRHLSTAEHGAYVLLILHYWQTGGLPTDEARLARIVGMSLDEWGKSRETLAEFFDDGWKHGRIEFELTEAARISAAGRAGGQASGRARRERSLNDRSNDQPTKREALHSPSPSQERTTTDPEFLPIPRAVAKATRPKVDEKFEDFWKVYPKRLGANPKTPALKVFQGLIKSGVDPGVIIDGARRCAVVDARKIGTEYIPQAVKWLRDRRWDDYPETAPANTEPVWKRPPPGARTHEEIIANNGGNHAAVGTEVRSNPGTVQERTH